MRPLRAPAPAAPRRDPAPSRWAYRWQRLWLTPLFRLTVRFVLPLALMAGSVALYLADEGRRGAIHAVYADLRSEFQNRPEFMVNLVAIEGASPVLAEAIRVGLALNLPRSSFDIDLQAARARVETFDAVERADLRIVSGGVLQVTVTERVPALVWRAPDGVWLVDAGGHKVARIGARSLRGDLPLIAGQGAADAAPEALALVQAAGPLVPRLRGLVRMGQRRWDLVLDRDQRILLPQENPVRALERLLALDQAESILARDITAVDLRHDRRPTLRLSPDAAETLRQVRLAQTGG
ncbi:MAG: cell division protein FtsQ/DivIB [Devosia sp.]